MAKDRNTMAKRQREVEKREKAARKLEKKETRKRERDKESCEALPLEGGEEQVLRIFSRFLMVPEKMLCISVAEVTTLLPSLESLIRSGLLRIEQFHGRYSLTHEGYQRMKKLN